MTRPLREALIRPQAIAHNVETLRGLTPTPQTMVVVKADGYGHGALRASRAALEGGATWLGTADIPEALELRSGGITAPILAWIYGPQDDVATAYQAQVDLGVSSLHQLEQVSLVVEGGVPARIHLKIDTGLARSGAWPTEWEALFVKTKQLEAAGVVELVGLFTHLSGASVQADSDQGVLFHQGLALAEAAGLTPQIRHVSASLGSSQTPALALDMVRFGVSAYGIALTPEQEQVGLQAAMRFSAQVTLVKNVPAGTPVGYGHTYTTAAETTLALVPVGYADGVPRHASNKGPVVLNGERYTVAGRVSMDQIVVDTHATPVSEGDWAVLWGDSREGHPTAGDWAEAADTIAYEIITRLGSRVTRVVQE
jgi:alanine racemase